MLSARGGSTRSPRHDLPPPVLDVAALQQENATLREQLARALASVEKLTELGIRCTERWLIPMHA